MCFFIEFWRCFFFLNFGILEVFSMFFFEFWRCFLCFFGILEVFSMGFGMFL